VLVFRAADNRIYLWDLGADNLLRTIEVGAPVNSIVAVAQSNVVAATGLAVPITVFLIFMIIYAVFGSFKWAALNLLNVLVARVGGLVALWVTGTHFSVSSGVGFLALFGVSVQTGVLMVEYINQLRTRGMPVRAAAIEGATRRLRPIMMTMLIATLGLLPAAMSHAIGSDSQRPFAIVIVGGLIADLLMSIFLPPTFYVWWARPNDQLPTSEESKSVYEQ
jgi:cobalt-zinc-cadmium resistance protein CzcA